MALFCRDNYYNHIRIEKDRIIVTHNGPSGGRTEREVKDPEGPFTLSFLEGEYKTIPDLLSAIEEKGRDFLRQRNREVGTLTTIL